MSRPSTPKHNMSSLTPGLYIVATPIGNLEDITLRAIRTLKDVSSIACENSRHSRILLNHYEVQKPLLTYNDHSSDAMRQKIIQKIKNGESIALISDAGMPLLSDPGYKLVRQLYLEQIPVSVIPGPSAICTSVALSGLATNSFFFQGFLPLKGWTKHLEAVAPLTTTLVFFESARRLPKTLQKCFSVLGNQRLVILRELTKRFEERLEGTLENPFGNAPTKNLKGEITFLIENRPGGPITS